MSVKLARFFVALLAAGALVAIYTLLLRPEIWIAFLEAEKTKGGAG